MPPVVSEPDPAWRVPAICDTMIRGVAHGRFWPTGAPEWLSAVSWSVLPSIEIRSSVAQAVPDATEPILYLQIRFANALRTPTLNNVGGLCAPATGSLGF
jgi:hypothetical protein